MMRIKLVFTKDEQDAVLDPVKRHTALVEQVARVLDNPGFVGVGIGPNAHFIHVGTPYHAHIDITGPLGDWMLGKGTGPAEFEGELTPMPCGRECAEAVYLEGVERELHAQTMGSRIDDAAVGQIATMLQRRAAKLN